MRRGNQLDNRRGRKLYRKHSGARNIPRKARVEEESDGTVGEFVCREKSYERLETDKVEVVQTFRRLSPFRQ